MSLLHRGVAGTHRQRGAAAERGIAVQQRRARPRLRLLEIGPARLRAACDRHDRTVEVAGSTWTVTDRLAPGATLRWRLPAGTWVRRPDGVEGAAAVIAVSADGPIDLRLTQSWDSPRYGERRRVPALVLRAGPEVTSVVTRIRVA